MRISYSGGVYTKEGGGGRFNTKGEFRLRRDSDQEGIPSKGGFQLTGIPTKRGFRLRGIPNKGDSN